jgi:hypothetical protein
LNNSKMPPIAPAMPPKPVTRLSVAALITLRESARAAAKANPAPASKRL